MSTDDPATPPSSVSSLLDFARGTKPADTAKPTLVSDIAEYRAALEWLPGEHARRLSGSLLIPYQTDKLHSATEEIISYSQLMSVHRDSTDGYMCLNFTIGSVEIEGKNMRALMMKFHPAGSVKELVIFNPEVHKLPAPGEPVIESIRFVSRAAATYKG